MFCVESVDKMKNRSLKLIFLVYFGVAMISCDDHLVDSSIPVINENYDSQSSSVTFEPLPVPQSSHKEKDMMSNFNMIDLKALEEQDKMMQDIYNNPYTINPSVFDDIDRMKKINEMAKDIESYTVNTIDITIPDFNYNRHHGSFEGLAVRLGIRLIYTIVVVIVCVIISACIKFCCPNCCLCCRKKRSNLIDNMDIENSKDESNLKEVV